MPRTPLLAAYLQRLAIGGSLAPGYGTLCGLQHAHMLSIPFENLDVLLGRPIRLDLLSLQDKLLTRKRGGYCFEHNTLFRAVLTSLGFDTVALSARVQLGSPAGSVPPRTHMCLRVELPEGPFLADAGFGGAGPRHPIALYPGSEAIFGNERHRLQCSGELWTLQSYVEAGFSDLYSFTLEPRFPIDVEVQNHFTSTHPASRFMQHLMVQRCSVDGSIVLRDGQLTVRRDGELTRSMVADREALVGVLREHFELDVPEVRSLHVPAVSGWG